MNELNLLELEKIQGGDFWGGFCDGAAVAGGALSIAAYAGLVSVGPAGWAVLGGIGIACVIF
ncbi:MAG: hypothetical protein L3J14_05065 [Flavobacteriaceae bacterium]|nr:hypothetical protein [Flavobacteriaceae bacterium]